MTDIELLCLCLIIFSLVVVCLYISLYQRISEIKHEISDVIYGEIFRANNTINKIQEIQDISEADIDKLYQEVNKVSSRYDEYVKLFTETRTEFNKIKMMLLTLKEKE